MSSLFDLLPPPKNTTYEVEEEKGYENLVNTQKPIKEKREIPSYPNRVGWIPKTLDDYNDGGAYPEIHVAQYPCKLGKDNVLFSTSNQERSILPYNIGVNNEQDFSNLLYNSQRKDKVVYSNILDIIEPTSEINLQKPSEESVNENVKETQKSIFERVNTKIAVSYKLRPDGNKERKNMKKYYKIKSFDDKKEEKIVQIIDEETDPLEPPQFRTKRLHRAPPSPPVPILHSPKRKIKKKDKDNWKIPPCISNWKNPRGYTIPLDKRLAADGRGLKKKQISTNFTDLMEAMYVAEQTAREEIENRIRYQEAIALKKKEEKEEKLRRLALEAKRDRESRLNYNNRERVRQEIHKQVTDDHNRNRSRKRKIRYDDDKERDITEKIALGIAPKSSKFDNVDTRLYEQAGSGIGSGFVRDDEYNIYSQPFRNVDKQIYTVDEERMKNSVGNMDDYTNLDRFSKNTRKRLGNEQEDEDENVNRRSGPVLFEKSSSSYSKDKKNSENKKKEDPFGFLGIVESGKRGEKRKRPGIMQQVGGFSNTKEYYTHQSKRRKVEFTSSKK